jgi:hypothetical protein
MMKFDKNKVKSVISRKKVGKKASLPKQAHTQSQAGQYVDSLLELHKLQGALLRHLREEI